MFQVPRQQKQVQQQNLQLLEQLQKHQQRREFQVL